MAVWNSTTSCPSSESDIMIRELSLGCQEGREYHCLLDHNGDPGEICIPRTWVEPEKCPEYNADAGKLDVYFCNEEHGTCPPKVYWSNTSFQYSGCMYIKTPQTNTTEASTVSIDHSSSNLVTIMPVVLGIVVAVIVIIIFISIALWMYRRRKPSRKDEEYRPDTIHDSNDIEKIPLLELNEDILHKGKLALEEHRQDTTYVPTQGYIWTTEVMFTHNIAVISGIVGSGKSKTALHTTSIWQKEGDNRRLLLIESINDIPDILQRKLDNVMIVMDDCFTRWTLEGTARSFSSTCAELYNRVYHSNNVKLIITIDYNIYQRHKQWLSHMDLFKEHLIITLPTEMASEAEANFIRNRPNMEELLQEERKMILQSHIDNQNAQNNYYIPEAKAKIYIALEDKAIHKIISRQYVNVGFPSVCTIFVRNVHALKTDFFYYCDTQIGKVIKMESEGVLGKRKRCVLSYAMLRDKYIDLDELDLEFLNKLGEHYELKPCDFETVKSMVKNLTKTFLIQTQNTIFRIAHTVVYNKHIQHWIHNRPHEFLELCNITLVKELVRPDGYQTKPGEPIFLVKGAAHIKHLAQRFKTLLPMHPELKHHPMMSNKDFQTEMEKDEERREFTDKFYGDYDNTYEEIKDSGADPEKGGADIQPLPPPSRNDERNK